MNEAGGREAPCGFEVADGSERWIGDFDDVAGSVIGCEFVEQDRFVVSPDALAQIVEQFDDRHDLLGRPVRIDQQGETVMEAGRLMMSQAITSLALRFLDFAADRSCASLRR